MAEAWIEALGKEVKSHWERTGKVLLLSAVPTVLERLGFPRDKTLMGRKLKDVLLFEGQGVVKLIKKDPYSGTGTSVFGIVPADAPLSEPIRQYFPETAGYVASPGYIRFKPAFWKAFASRIPEGSRRFLLPEEGVRFVDLSADQPAPPGWIEVEREYTGVDVASMGPEHVQSTLNRIKGWVEKNGRTQEEFAIPSGPRIMSDQLSTPVAPNAQPHASAKVPIKVLLDNIDDKDLHRINIPLDIVISVISKIAK